MISALRSSLLVNPARRVMVSIMPSTATSASSPRIVGFHPMFLSSLSSPQSTMTTKSCSSILPQHQTGLVQKDQKRNFAATTSVIASKKLANVISRELKEEEENGLGQMPEELEDLQKKVAESWKIVQGGATIKMFKKEPLSNGAKVSISFHCQDTINPDEMMDPEEMNQQQGQDGNNEEEEELSASARFTVSVVKAGKVMKLQCATENAEAFVESVAMTDEETEKAPASVQEESYNGPEFVELAEDVQEAFNAYLLKECKVDDDVAVYIAMMADFAEQTEYMNWLRGVKKILE